MDVMLTIVLQELHLWNQAQDQNVALITFLPWSGFSILNTSRIFRKEKILHCTKTLSWKGNSYERGHRISVFLETKLWCQKKIPSDIKRDFSGKDTFASVNQYLSHSEKNAGSYTIANPDEPKVFDIDLWLPPKNSFLNLTLIWEFYILILYLHAYTLVSTQFEDT